MRNPVVASAALVLLLVGGCATAPAPAPATKVTPVAKAAAPSSPKPVAAPVFTSPTNAPAMTAPSTQNAASQMAHAKPLKLSPEAAALVARLTEGDSDTLPHEISETTDFPGAMKSLDPAARAPRVENGEGNIPQPPPRGLTADGNSTYLVDRDWTGLVLVPISKSLSKAHTSDVRLTKVEAHPLTDGRVRIWTRLQNTSAQTLPAEIALEFRIRGVHLTSPYFYELDVPANGYRDVFFVSPDGELNSYTVLVRSAGSVQH